MANHIDFYTFVDNGEMPGQFFHQGRYSQITIGSIDAESFGGGTLLIQKDTLNGSVHTIRAITEDEFYTMQDRTLRMELPTNSTIRMSLINATSPNLYVEHRQQRNR